MKKSELLQIIKEEIKNVFEAEDPTQTSLRKALVSKGAEFSPGGGNRLKKEEKYTFIYDYFINADDTDDDEITVTASSPDEARKKAYQEVRFEQNKAVRGGIKGLSLYNPPK